MLIVYFSKELFKLYYVNSIIRSDALIVGNVVYTRDLNSTQNDGFVGFYDWLRSDESTIVGIRICYFENQHYNEFLKTLSYIRPTFENRCMELLFDEKVYNPAISGDQDFTNNYVFQSQAGDCLFTFGLDHLTEEELDSLVKQCSIIDEERLY